MRHGAPAWPTCLSIWVPALEGAQRTGRDRLTPHLRSALPLHSS